MGAPSGKYAVAQAIAKEKYDADIRSDAVKQLMLSPLDDLIKEWNEMKSQTISKASGSKRGGSVKISKYSKGGGVRTAKYKV
tara:strand:- start:31 stop:276 length:246 start_codon:yes stop_codon:yes gene_type:complete